MLGSGRPGASTSASTAWHARPSGTSRSSSSIPGTTARHARVLDAWARANAEAGTRVPAPLYHVPNHRNQSPPWGTTCSGYNTSAMLADGELVVFLLDYGFAPSDWLQRHVDAHEGKRRLVLAPHVYYAMPPVVTRGRWAADRRGGVERQDAPSSSTAERAFATTRSRSSRDPGSDPGEMLDRRLGGDPKCEMPEGPVPTGLFPHGKMRGFPLDAILEINGMDEHFDRMRGPGDPGACLPAGAGGTRACGSPSTPPSSAPTREAISCPSLAAPATTTGPTPGHEWRLDYSGGRAVLSAEQRGGGGRGPATPTTCGSGARRSGTGGR